MVEQGCNRRVLVTGPDGFVGVALCSEFQKRGFLVRGAQWQSTSLPEGCESVVVGDIGDKTDWRDALKDVDVVVHLAARTHIMRDTCSDSLAEYRKVNVEGTLRLAVEAVKTGVKRFVFMSTIKVNGERTANSFREVDVPHPEDAYGISKWEAEQALHETVKNSGMEIVVIRAPLIYGPGVKGNFLQLLKLARTGVPLPLGAIQNRRSLVYLMNLVDFIIHCATHPEAGHQLFLISDGEDLSTPELMREIRDAMRFPRRLLWVPALALRLLGLLTGKSSVVNRLCGSLVVDCSKGKSLLGWRPPFTVREGILATVTSCMEAMEGQGNESVS